jgi:restriction endonuclease S subunit
VATIKKAIQLKKGNVLLTRKGTFGIATSIDSDVDDIISSEVFRIEIDKSVDSFYLVAVLNSPIGQIQFDRIKIGAIMGSLSQDSVKSILIPKPKPEEQRDITNKIREYLKKADELKNESLKIIDKAKKEAEKILLSRHNESNISNRS